MKLFLTQNAVLGVPPKSKQDVSKGVRPLFVKITPNLLGKGSSSEVTHLCNILRQRLQAPQQPGCARSDKLAFQFRQSAEDTIGLRVTKGPLTNALLELFGEDLRIQLTFKGLYTEDHGPFRDVKSKEMKFEKYEDYFCQDGKLVKGENETWELLDGDDLRAAVTITIIWDNNDLSEPVVTDRMQVCRKMLLEELGSDLVIIPENGKQVKAHKCMLLAHSDVLNAMFRSDMEEAKTSTVEMPDMSEEGVRGLLAYLYCWEMSGPNSKPVVAFEMLCAGHKYDIPVLEAAMKTLLLGKPDKWYDIEVAMKLFLLARNLPEDGDRLKMKAIQVLEGNYETFKKSSVYVALFKENPGAAMELFQLFVEK